VELVAFVIVLIFLVLRFPFASLSLMIENAKPLLPVLD